MNSTIVTWLATTMLSWVTPGYSTPDVYNQETVEEGTARYYEIAESASRVAFDPKERPLFAGSDARIKTAWALIAVAYHEGKWKKSVQHGDKKGDHGNSWCLMQINLGKKKIVNPEDPDDFYEDSLRKTFEGWSGLDLVNDMDKCFRTGLHLMHSSWYTCGLLLNKNDWMSEYATGGCKEDTKASKEIMELIQSKRVKKLNKTDNQIRNELTEIAAASDPIPEASNK